MQFDEADTTVEVVRTQRDGGAARATHRPTRVVVAVQDHGTADANREQALAILRMRVEGLDET